VIGIAGTGGEGGIRTPGTGVSPYNGLASVPFFVRLNRIKRLQTEQMRETRGEPVPFGSYCSPLCSPFSRAGNGYLTGNSCNTGKCSFSYVVAQADAGVGASLSGLPNEGISLWLPPEFCEEADAG
jgi:hypothetical protein